LAEPLHTVAVLVANPALSSILSMTLAGVPSLRVRPFGSLLEMSTYMRLAPIDLIVADFDSVASPADRVADSLRHEAKLPRSDFQVIALASALSTDAKAASIHAGIDEIIMKPMSPKYLVERVLARLTRRPANRGYPGPERRVPRTRSTGAKPTFTDNVVPLFGRTPEPLA
jgi:two-component system, OmpR family, phosphate regulon response regulator PhoB